MFRSRAVQYGNSVSFLHACGDVSIDDLLDSARWEFSPRMWRCFLSILCTVAADIVFSTHVEMFPHPYRDCRKFYWFSPRMWRCFCRRDLEPIPCRVFSTHVEMFLRASSSSLSSGSFLHACGDVSRCSAQN